MYENIIEQLYSDIHTQYENDMVKVVQSYGFNVDKEELAKALAYDRDQYEKGYEDGKREMLEEQNKYRWHDLRKNPDDLPYDDSIEYIVCVEYRSGRRECTIGCLDMGGEMMILPALGNWIGNGYHIIAWREIEPFEEVSE